jgi:hypothetical protein
METFQEALKDILSVALKVFQEKATDSRVFVPVDDQTNITVCDIPKCLSLQGNLR